MDNKKIIALGTFNVRSVEENTNEIPKGVQCKRLQNIGIKEIEEEELLLQLLIQVVTVLM